MPIIKSAIKRMRQTNKRRERNVGIKKDIKSAVKAFVATPSAETLAKSQSEIDKAVKKGLIKKNTAARRKSSLSVAAKKAGVKLEAKKVAKPAAAKKSAAAKKVETGAKAPAKKPAAKKVAAAKKPAVKKSPAKKADK